MESVNKGEKTLFFLFLKQVIVIAAAVSLEVVIFISLFSMGLNSGIILPANYVENYLLQIEDEIVESEPFSEEILPQNCKYGLYDFSGKYLKGNLEKEVYISNGLIDNNQAGYKVIRRVDGYCIIQYSVEAQFSNPALHRLIPNLEITVIVLFFVIFVIIIAVNSFLFGKKLQYKLKPLLDEIEHIKDRELFSSTTKSDIREFNEVLSALNEMKGALADSLKKEWQAEQRKKENISALAHDIKTPLTIIKGNAELLKEENDMEQVYGYADIINDNTDRIEHYIRLLIDETNGIIAESETCLRDLISNIKVQSEILCTTKHMPILFSEKVASCMDCRIDDAERILRAVLNVVANAIEYTDSQKGIRVEIAEANRRIAIKVEDYGSGFSKEALLHAKEQFFTEKKERSGGHYGLGLYFAETVAKEYGGEICIENKANGDGAEVTLYFEI